MSRSLKKREAARRNVERTKLMRRKRRRERGQVIRV
jgi:hypothetical protein